MNALIEKNAGLLDLIGRIFLSVVFIVAGVAKIGSYEQTAGWMESMGVPGFLLPLVIITEVVFPILFLIGWKTRLWAFLLAGFCVLTGVIFHFDPGNQGQMTQLFKNLAIGGGFIAYMVHGAGSISLDERAKAG
ncbi:MAG: DoxX family protein [Alphaproteobacteria bacterium]|nr:DoxX family protein [Alphaproteobacteria bacterium]